VARARRRRPVPPTARGSSGSRRAFGGVPDRLARAVAARGVVVTTGQQPGLFGGPIYTWTKAISALALADALERATGCPPRRCSGRRPTTPTSPRRASTQVAVPGGLDTLRARTTARRGLPMAACRSGDVRALLARLRRGAGSAATLPRWTRRERAYTAPGATVGGAYLALLRELLEPLGIAVLDASDPAVRRAGAALMRRALVEGAAIDEALADRERALTRAGHPLQVAPVADLTLVFETAPDGTKQRVPRSRATAVAAGASDDALGPNVLLRPVLERSVLPTVAYVAGPGELAYFAQVSAVAAALGRRATARGAALVGDDRRAARATAARAARLDGDALREPARGRGALARAAMPAPAARCARRGARGRGAPCGRDRRRRGGDARARRGARGAATAAAARLDGWSGATWRRSSGARRSSMRDVPPRAARSGRGVAAGARPQLLPLLARQGRPLHRAMRSEADARWAPSSAAAAPDA
jgi:hypothetical protein